MRGCIPKLLLRDIERHAESAWKGYKRYLSRLLIKVQRKKETCLLNVHRHL